MTGPWLKNPIVKNLNLFFSGMEHQVTVEISVYGKVQGVGFRPLVCRLAKENKLTGFVRNAGTHVEIIATGFPDAIQQLCDSLYRTAGAC